MTNNLDLNTALIRLESNSLEEQAAALDEATVMLKEFGKRVVDRFVRSDDRYIIWERLIRFGWYLIDPLKEVLSHTEDPEIRDLSAILLLKLGDKTGVPILLDIISTGEEWVCQAAFRLAEAQIVEAGDRMIERLKVLEFTNKLHLEGVLCLLTTLKKMGRTLPPDLVERFQGADAPWEVRMYLK
ncbi:MAG: HEAT repeat domain-containing protein [Ktedonobacteraceae bacterium]